MARPPISVGLPERLRAEAARLYLEAFGAKLGPILGRDARAEAFIADVLRPDHAVVAEDEGGRLLGLAGFHDEAGGFVGGGFRDLAQAYGLFGALWRAPALELFERSPEPRQLLMDGLVVAPEARGRGVGGAILNRIEALAIETGRAEVRLDVVDTNPRARALYERRGFEAVAETGSRLLRPIFGFSRSTTMVLAV
ncbi:MAG: GNAT family N-acetyltransferase [Pseudomonadota bacterium]